MMLKIKSFAEIDLEFLNSGILVLLDIDDTLFSALTNWGANNQFGTMFKAEVGKGYTPNQARENIYPRWIEAQSNVPTRLVDPQIHRFLDLCKEANCITMGFTARRPIIANATEKQLASHNIKFENLEGLIFERKYPKYKHCDTLLISKMPNMIDDCDAVYSNGTLYCHDLNSKGVVFASFYEVLKTYCIDNNLNIPKGVLFVDDGEHNINALGQTCESLGLTYYGYLIENINHAYDATLAHEEEHTFKTTGSFRRTRSFS